MCRPDDTSLTGRKNDRKLSDKESSSSLGAHYSMTTLSGIAFLLFLLTAPLLLSEVIGGWTRKYTSSVSYKPVDMKGKVVIVSGANTGIGFETTLELARNGAHVIATSRNKTRGDAALKKLYEELGTNRDGSVEFLQLDLSSLDSVEQFAEEFTKLGLPLHALVLNAGVMKSPGAIFVGEELTYGFGTTKDGFEQHIGVNHVAHAYLTKLLLEKLKESAPSRIISVASSAEMAAYEEGFVFDQWVPMDGKMPATYGDGAAYGQSKLANLVYAKALAEKLEGTGVSCYALHPGVIMTELARTLVPEMEGKVSTKPFAERMLTQLFGAIFLASNMSPKTGALTQLHLITSLESELVNGGFYHPVGTLVNATHAQGQNETMQSLLWEQTERAISERGNYKF